MEINLFKYFTIARFTNAIKIILSFQVSKILRKPIVWGSPLTLSIEPTNRCNLKCPECPSGTGELTRPLGFMKFDLFKKIIDEVKNKTFYIQLFFQGEPFINKEIFSMINYAKDNNVYVSVSTNGLLINEKNVVDFLNAAPDKLIFSIDGLDEQTYQNYRVGGTFKKADEALRILSDAKNRLNLKKPFIELQFIVMKQNEHQIKEVLKYGKEAGADKVVLKTMQVNSYESAKYYLPENKKYSRYILNDRKIKLKKKLKNHCFGLWRTSVVTWDGRIVPCCFDKDGEYEMAKMNGSSFNAIWKNENYMRFRKKIFKDRVQIPICTNCTEGLKINILEK